MGELLVSEAFDMYRDDFIRFKNQSMRTEEGHEKCKEHFIEIIGDKALKSLSLADVRDFKNELTKGRSQNTVRYYIIRLRAVITYCNIRDIPCIKSGLVPVPKRLATVPTFLTSEEVASMIKCSKDIRVKFVISLLYSSGIRLSELISLNRGQISDYKFTVIGKGSKARLCFIDLRTEKYMNLYLAKRTDNEEALVVSYIHKKRMTATNIQLLIRNAAKRAGLSGKRVTPHTLRHSYATNFLRNNGNMRYLSAMLGHASMDTTAMYAHVVDNDMEAQYRKYHSI